MANGAVIRWLGYGRDHDNDRGGHGHAHAGPLKFPKKRALFYHNSFKLMLF